MRRNIYFVAGILMLAVGGWPTSSLSGAPKAGADRAKPRRVKPPEKWDKEVLRVFSSNPRSLLSGERPDFGASVADPIDTAVQAPITAGDLATGGWSKLISADALADEVKLYPLQVTKQLSSLSTFNGGGFREAQFHYSMVAVALAITAEYDGDARWKNQAAGARDLFARVANNLKVATDATFKESKARAEDLENLVRGGTVEVKPAETSVPWNGIADFNALMKRLDLAHKERLTPWTSNKSAFDPKADETLHEAQIIAALAEIIQKDDYDYSGDETFARYAKEMQEAALKAAEGVKANNYEQVRAAAGLIYQSCEKCHGDYRG